MSGPTEVTPPTEVFLVWCNDMVLSVCSTEEKGVAACQAYMDRHSYTNSVWRRIPGLEPRWTEEGGGHYPRVARLEVKRFPVE